MRRVGRLGVFAFVVSAILAACGSRTGLIADVEDEPPAPDAARDVSLERDVAAPRSPDAVDEEAGDEDVADEPIVEGGPLDVVTDCPDPAYCDPSNLGFVFRCGQPIFQCSSLEQCEARDGVAQCVNPCLDTLGQDTSNGCEFYANEMDIVAEARGVCYAVFIVNQWKTGEPARIEVDHAGDKLPLEQFARIPQGTGTQITYAPYDAKAGLPAGQIAILFLSRDPAADADPDPASPRRLAACPPGITPAVVGDAATHSTGLGTSFHIKTNVPVVAYQMLPYGGGRARVTGATLLLPTNVWDKNYVAANAYAASGPGGGLPTLAILGQADNTHVRVKPTAAIQGGGGILASPANVSAAYVVNKGQYLQFTQTNELTGSAIQADQPIAVIGGSTGMNVPVGRIREDAAEQMLPPVHALGSEYVGVRYRSRDPAGEETVPWRIVGVVDGTRLTFDPPVPGAPATVDARRLVELNSPGPFVVRSQGSDHPFYFAQYMTGGCSVASPNDSNCNEGQAYDGMGDPEFVNVVPPKQYLPRYTFFTDPTYPETNLVITRSRDAATGLMPDVALDCAGTLGGWRSVGTGGLYEFTRIDLSTGNFQGQNGCNNGVHTIVGTINGDAGAGAASFGVTVWGFGNPVTWPPRGDETNPLATRWVSYGYPAGANFTPLNRVTLRAQ